MVIFGYARVSSKSQELDRQLIALHNFGIDERYIVCDNTSGATLDRTGYQSLKNYMLRDGDTLVITSLDRLSRSKDDIVNELRYFKEHNITLKVLNIPLTLQDYPKEVKPYMDIAYNIMIEVISSFAEFERKEIKERQKEGIESAHLRGVKFGRPRFEIPEEYYRIRLMVENKVLKPVDAMYYLKMTKSTWYKLANRVTDVDFHRYCDENNVEYNISEIEHIVKIAQKNKVVINLQKLIDKKEKLEKEALITSDTDFSDVLMINE